MTAAVKRLPGALFRRSSAAFKLLSNIFVVPLEALATREFTADPTCAGPVFIVGAPRSGTTLLYQLMTAAFDFAYLSNRHCRWFHAPVFMENFRPTPFGECQDFTSEFGVTTGAHAPSECGHYWYRFLPRRPHSLSMHDVDPERLRALGRSVTAMSAVTERPMIFKNVILSLRIEVLVNAFPKAVFIVCRRDPTETAISILRARERRFGSLAQWFSVRPARCRELVESHDAFEQVAAQIHGTHDEIARARIGLPVVQFIDVGYENLCDSPRLELQRIRDSLAAAGVDVTRRTDFACPPQFTVSRNVNSVPEEWRQRIHASLNPGAGT